MCIVSAYLSIASCVNWKTRRDAIRFHLLGSKSTASVACIWVWLVCKHEIKAQIEPLVLVQWCCGRALNYSLKRGSFVKKQTEISYSAVSCFVHILKQVCSLSFAVHRSVCCRCVAWSGWMSRFLNLTPHNNIILTRTFVRLKSQCWLQYLQACMESWAENQWPAKIPLPFTYQRTEK